MANRFLKTLASALFIIRLDDRIGKCRLAYEDEGCS